VIALDQLSKYWTVIKLRSGETLRLPGPLDLTLTFNQSNAFGLVPVAGGVTRWGLIAFNLSVAVVLAFVLWRRRLSLLRLAGFAFILAGALGNALDRFRLGAVIDMLDARKIGFPWVFNGADAAVDLGLAALLLSALLEVKVSPDPNPR
jgi:signal peptidase II